MMEKELILRVREGDREAFNELYKIHWANLVKYASLVAGSVHAKDIVHDVFLKLWMNRANLQEKDTLRPYLMRSVYNKSLNVLRGTARLETMDTWFDNQIDILTAGEYNPDNSEIVRKLYDKDVAVQIEKAMDALPDRCREIFRCCYVEGKSHKEVAEKLGISLSTVDNQIYKALKILRSSLAESTFLLLLLLIIK